MIISFKQAAVKDAGLLVGRCYADSPDIDGQVFFAGGAEPGAIVPVVIEHTEDGLLYGHLQEARTC